MNCTWLNPIAAPLAMLLMVLYRIFQGWGDPGNTNGFAYALALFLIAVIVRGLLLPFQMKSKRGMLKQSRLQPKMAELQKRHGANKQKYNEELAKLYKDEGINPASGCLWSFIQMPIMIALFYAIRQPLGLMMRIPREIWSKGGAIFDRLIALYRDGALSETGGFYSELTTFIGDEGIAKLAELESLDQLGFYAELYASHEISEHWAVFENLGIEGLRRISFYLGNLNLAEIPNWRLWDYDWSGTAWVPTLLLFFFPIISGGSQFVSAHINRKMNPQQSPEAAQGAGGTIMKLMPLMSVWFGFILPAALSFYWTIGTCLQIAQDVWLTKRYTRILDAEDEVRDKIRAEKEAEIEAKRLETERLKAEGQAAENRNKSKRRKEKIEKQTQREKAAEWEKKNAPPDEKEEKDEPSRVGNRKYARGRAYDPDRYAHSGSEDETDEEITEEITEQDDTVYEGEIIDDNKED